MGSADRDGESKRQLARTFEAAVASHSPLALLLSLLLPPHFTRRLNFHSPFATAALRLKQCALTHVGANELARQQQPNCSCSCQSRLTPFAATPLAMSAAA